MIYSYGSASRQRLATCDPRIKLIMRKALALGLVDISIIEGVRVKEEQNRFYYMRPQKSKVKWPYSKHNIINPKDKSLAFDAGPFINGKVSYNFNHCCYLAGIIIALSASLGIKLRWGGNWDMDGEPITDQDFQDLIHYEIVE